MTAITSRASTTFQTIEQFQHRDDRGGGIQHNGLPSKTPEEATARLWRGSAGWPDKNGDGRYDVTYTFREPPEDKHQRQHNKSGFTHVLENQRQQTRRSLQSIADVANVRFTEGPKTASSEGHITLGNYADLYNKKGQSVAAYPQTSLPNPKDRFSGDAWFVDTKDDQSVPNASHGDAGRFTLVHELGHALGLSHPSQYDVSSGSAKAGYLEDSESHTTMSYLGERHGYMNHGGIRASAPQLDDISAYQQEYGANHETRKDDTTYGFNSNTDRDFLSVKADQDKMVAAIWDGGGTDTLDFSGYQQDQQISLKAGTFSDVGGLKGNVSIAYGVTIENAVGGFGNDLLVGNGVANTLNGGEGNDRIYGAGGADILWGGKGNDVFVYGKTNESTRDAPDQIMDFVSGEDRVDVSGIRATLGDKPLTFVRAFSGASGEAMVTYDPAVQRSTLQISGKPDEPAFLLVVHGKLQQGDIVS
ncbi:serralysin family metalloprotease [Pseudomonas simiae]|uniref:serralysin family metalloprotease n=1 Tax=Pseudomonas simiae TaxID=321846 RepID=UPI00165491B3|nr:serralysin family metalloprotease [Pseudomonas simiae]MBC3966550.1 serralysin family metalloprotease [Pseudomonas simiae]UNK64212.1 serralysin family metalloprotease [Pseudomonas simiae]WLG31791.1 serralysin family metalloprotease [Pseudomonas simiae]WLI21798.1 serralysin family metalloprotease [Pseudomonas simiae]